MFKQSLLLPSAALFRQRYLCNVFERARRSFSNDARIALAMVAFASFADAETSAGNSGSNGWDWVSVCKNLVGP